MPDITWKSSKIIKFCFAAVKHNGVTKLANINLEVCFKIFTDIDNFRNGWYEITGNVWQMTEDDIYEAGQKLQSIKLEEVCNQHVTDEQGRIKFTVDMNKIDPKASKLSIQSKATDYDADQTTGREQPVGKLDVR